GSGSGRRRRRFPAAARQQGVQRPCARSEHRDLRLRGRCGLRGGRRLHGPGEQREGAEQREERSSGQGVSSLGSRAE
ncbi:hypothetical protein AB0C69_16910, partial [Actinomadura sp. NPDC048032]|uniref:hypothetical protein n=1 Tax=Actinomadura sp. NPDC048032 TaxID=3155747 RepID=UPI0033DC798E